MRSFRRSALSLAVHIAVGGLTSFGVFVSNNALANEYNATAAGVNTYGDLTQQVLFNGLKPSDYDTIYWTGPGTFDVWEDLNGGTPPYTGVLGLDSMFRNIRVQGTNTGEIFTFRGGRSAGCNPCVAEGHNVSTHSLTIDNIAFSMAEYPGGGLVAKDYIENFLIYNNGSTPGQLNLNNGHLRLDQSFGTGAQLTLAGAAEINVTGTKNQITAPGGAFGRSTYETKLHLHTGSKLEINGTTELNMRDFGYLQMDQGSELNVVGSKVVLTKQETASTPNSVIDGGTINISGLYGNDPASLVLSTPTIKNSTINIGQNTRFASSTKANGVLQAANFYFEGDNTVTLEIGAAMGGFTGENTDGVTGFYFKNGLTKVKGVRDGSSNSKLYAFDINLDNAHLHYDSVDIQNDLQFLSLENGSTLSHNENNGENLDNLKLLKVDNSSIDSDFDFGLVGLTKMTFNSATIRQTDSRLTRPSSFYFNGIDGFGADAKATATFSGSSVFESRIDPSGKSVGIPTGNPNLPIFTYADALYFTRNKDFSDEASTVNGLANLTVELNAFAPGLTADDYASGGENSDGVYDVMVFNKSGTATTDATADSDTVAVRLGQDMPALLQATQVATPSANQQVSYKLEKVAPTAVAGTLTSKPNVTTSNQTSSANLLANANQNGNSAVQAALNTLTNAQTASSLDTAHPEPYSSNMTVSMEHADLMLNTILGQAAINNAFSSDISSLNFQPSFTSASQGVVGNQLDFGQSRSERSWGDASYIKGKVEGDEDGLGTYKYSVGSLTFGHDFLQTKNSNIGAYFSLGDQSLDEHDKAEQSFQATTFHMGAYGSLALDSGWEARGVWGVGFADNESQRLVVVGSTAGQAEADYDSYTTYLGAAIGKTIYKSEVVSLQPEAGINYIYYKQDEVQESGSTGFELNIDDASAQSLVSSIALKARFQELGEHKISPLAFVRYEFDLHAAKNSAHDIDAALASQPGYKQSFSGKNRGKHALSTGLGFDTALDSNLQLGGGVAYSFNSHGYEWGAGFNLGYYW